MIVAAGSVLVGVVVGPWDEAERGASMADRYVVACECGWCLEVGPDSAGSAVGCTACGAKVAVPSLSRLREMNGAGAYESGPADTIRRLVSLGRLPGGTTCARTGRPTDDVLGISVVVSDHLEPTAQARAAGLRAFALGGIFGTLFVKALRDNPADYRPVAGTEVHVPTPVRLSARFHPGARSARRSRIERYLRTVPAYSALLDRYPEARFVVEGPISPPGDRSSS